MAFCPSCGATVQGAFCQQCGAPLSATAAAAVPPPVTAAAPPLKRKTSPLVWILVAILGLFVLFIVALVGAGLFFARNPGLVMSKLITAGNPNLEVIGTDTGTQSMRIRDKTTGEEVTVSFDDVKNGRFKLHAIGRNGEVANVEIGGGAGKLPSWVPAYPGARAQGNFTAKGMSADGMGEGGVVSFTTPDPASNVVSFYAEKCKDMGMTVALTDLTGQGGMMVATDEAGRRTLHVLVGSGVGSGIGTDSGDTTITVTFGRKR
jgi:hypothetical protein